MRVSKVRSRSASQRFEHLNGGGKPLRLQVHELKLRPGFRHAVGYGPPDLGGRARIAGLGFHRSGPSHMERAVAAPLGEVRRR